MWGKIALAANALLNVGVLCLVAIYAELHWWFRSARRAGLEDSQLRTDFVVAADRLHILAICLAALLVVANFSLWRSEMRPRVLALCVFIWSMIVLVICLVLRV